MDQGPRTRDSCLQAAKLEEKLKFINEAIPTKVYNTMSSTAGAGSGDFHMYRIVSSAHACGPCSRLSPLGALAMPSLGI